MKLQALPNEGPRLQADPKGLASAPRLGKWATLGGDCVGRENVWEASFKKRRFGGDEGAGEPQSRWRRAQDWRNPRERVPWEKSALLLPAAQREGRRKMGKAPWAIPPGETEHHPQLPLLCVTPGKCMFGGSSFPLEALRVSSQATLPSDFDAVKHRWVRS